MGAVAEQGGGDDADGQGGHEQHGVLGNGGLEPDLGLVESEAGLAELEIFFAGSRPISMAALSSSADQTCSNWSTSRNSGTCDSEHLKSAKAAATPVSSTSICREAG